MQHVTVILTGDTLSLIFSSHLLVFLLFFAYLKLSLSVRAALDCIKVGWEEPAGKWFSSWSVCTSTSCVCVCVRAPSSLQTFHPLWAPSICHHQSRALVIPLPSVVAATSQVQPGPSPWGLPQRPPRAGVTNLQEVFTTYLNLSKPRSSIFPGSFFHACPYVKEIRHS